MKDIKASVCFAKNSYPDNGEICIQDPLSTIHTLYLPTLFTVSVVLTVAGLNAKLEPLIQITLRRKDNGNIIYQTEKQKFYTDDGSNSLYNTILVANLTNLPLKETTSGEYEVILNVTQDGHSMDYVCEQTLKIIADNVQSKTKVDQTIIHASTESVEPQKENEVPKTTDRPVQKHKWYEFWKW